MTQNHSLGLCAFNGEFLKEKMKPLVPKKLIPQKGYAWGNIFVGRDFLACLFFLLTHEDGSAS